MIDVEITGAASAAVDLAEASRVSILASHIHDNPGVALAIRGGAAPRINHNLFARNGLSERIGAALLVERDTQPTFFGNIFLGVVADVLRPLATGRRAGRSGQLVRRCRRSAGATVECSARPARTVMDTVFNSVGPYGSSARSVERNGHCLSGHRHAVEPSRRPETRAHRERSRSTRNCRGRAMGCAAARAFCAQVALFPRSTNTSAAGKFYIAMEYLEGRNLSDVIAAGPLAPERAVGVTAQLCGFSEAAHSSRRRSTASRCGRWCIAT